MHFKRMPYTPYPPTSPRLRSNEPADKDGDADGDDSDDDEDDVHAEEQERE